MNGNKSIELFITKLTFFPFVWFFFPFVRILRIFVLKVMKKGFAFTNSEP